MNRWNYSIRHATLWWWWMWVCLQNHKNRFTMFRQAVALPVEINTCYFKFDSFHQVRANFNYFSRNNFFCCKKCLFFLHRHINNLILIKSTDGEKHPRTLQSYLCLKIGEWRMEMHVQSSVVKYAQTFEGILNDFYTDIIDEINVAI